MHCIVEGHKIWYFRFTLFLFQEIGILYCQNEATLMGQLVNWEAVKPSRRAIQRGGGVAVGGEGYLAWKLMHSKSRGE